MNQHKLRFTFIILTLHSLALSLSSSPFSNSSDVPAASDGSFVCNFDMFEAMGICNTNDYQACCISVKTAMYAGCLCTTVFQDYIRYCIEVTRELDEYLDRNCVPDQIKIDQVECYQNLTYHEQHDPAVYSLCPLVSISPSSAPDPDDRVSPWQWFWSSSGTLPPSEDVGNGDEGESPSDESQPRTGAESGSSEGSFQPVPPHPLVEETSHSPALVQAWVELVVTLVLFFSC